MTTTTDPTTAVVDAVISDPAFTARVLPYAAFDAANPDLPAGRTMTEPVVLHAATVGASRWYSHLTVGGDLDSPVFREDRDLAANLHVFAAPGVDWLDVARRIHAARR